MLKVRAVRDIDIPLLATFLDLCETQSFTRTALRVHRTQSAISAQVARLEEMLGVQLFLRTTRTVILTPDGERLIPHARQVVDSANALLARFRDIDVEGDVRLGCPEDVAGADLPSILADFARVHPRVRLHVRCYLTLHLVEQFEDGAFDLVIIKQDPGRIRPGATPLREERLAWAGPPGQSEEPILKADGAVPLVLAPAPCVYRARALEALAVAGIDGDVVYASPSEAGQIAAVRAGLGWTVLPQRRVADDLTTGAPPQWPELPPALICLLMASRPTGAVETFARFAGIRLQGH